MRLDGNVHETTLVVGAPTGTGPRPPRSGTFGPERRPGTTTHAWVNEPRAVSCGPGGRRPRPGCRRRR
jgi:hypothetical protein